MTEVKRMSRKMVKACDYNEYIAAVVFKMLNEGNVKLCQLETHPYMQIETDIEPCELTYPEGWYYGNGCLRNKHESTTGAYYEVRMVKSDGTRWGDIAKYCNR